MRGNHNIWMFANNALVYKRKNDGCKRDKRLWCLQTTHGTFANVICLHMSGNIIISSRNFSYYTWWVAKGNSITGIAIGINGWKESWGKAVNISWLQMQPNHALQLGVLVMPNEWYHKEREVINCPLNRVGEECIFSAFTHLKLEWFHYLFGLAHPLWWHQPSNIIVN